MKKKIKKKNVAKKKVSKNAVKINPKRRKKMAKKKEDVAEKVKDSDKGEEQTENTINSSRRIKTE
jgi:hypothetical protein